MKQDLQRKLEHLYEFNAASGSNYDMAFELAANILNGLNQIQNSKGFNRKDGTFSVEGMKLDWLSELDEAHYKMKAKNKYGDYLEENEDDMDKIIEVIKYEEKHPEKVAETDEFLSPLEEKHKTEIKYLIYTAEEPYRTLAMKYMDRFELVKLTPKVREEEDIDPDGVFRYWQDTIYV